MLRRIEIIIVQIADVTAPSQRQAGIARSRQALIAPLIQIGKRKIEFLEQSFYRLAVVVDQDDLKVAQRLRGYAAQCIDQHCRPVIGGEDDREQALVGVRGGGVAKQLPAYSVDILPILVEHLGRKAGHAPFYQRPHPLGGGLQARFDLRVGKVQFENMQVLPQRPLRAVKILGHLIAMNTVANRRTPNEGKIRVMTRHSDPQLPVPGQHALLGIYALRQAHVIKHAAPQHHRRRGDVVVEGQQINDLVAPTRIGVRRMPAMVDMLQDLASLVDPGALGIGQ